MSLLEHYQGAFVKLNRGSAAGTKDKIYGKLVEMIHCLVHTISTFIQIDQIQRLINLVDRIIPVWGNS